MDELTTTSGLVALAAAALALLALVVTAVLARRIRRLRADQKAVLGEEQTDLVGHAAQLDRGFHGLREFVTDAAASLDGRLSETERRLDGAVAFHAIVRYDAYNEMSGRQSTSRALLDAHGSGVVLSSIHHRDQARLYAKQVVAGRGELELSPEEEEAVRAALAREAPDPAP
jgi:hypothetical protein